MSGPNETSCWVACAMEHVRVLVDEIGLRPSASPAEREAAEYVHGVMEGDGLNLKDVRHELFPGLPSAHRPLRNCLVMALLGLLFALRGREHGDWWGDFFGVLAVLPGALAAYSAYSIFTLRDRLLYKLMGKRASQNTVGVGGGAHTIRLTGEGMLQYDQVHPGARIIAEAATARPARPERHRQAGYPGLYADGAGPQGGTARPGSISTRPPAQRAWVARASSATSPRALSRRRWKMPCVLAGRCYKYGMGRLIRPVSHSIAWVPVKEKANASL